MGEVHRLPAPRVSFSLQTAGRLMTEIFPQWVQDLALLIESVETVRPPGALPDWQPGATVRLPYSRKVCSDAAVVCTQALMALADTAMVLACSAAWNGYRPMTSIDQTTHFLRPVNFDVVADARVVRIGRNTSLWPSYAAQCRRPQAGRDGGKRLCDVVGDRNNRPEIWFPSPGCRFKLYRFKLYRSAARLHHGTETRHCACLDCRLRLRW